MAVLVFRGDRWRWGRGGWGGFIPHAGPGQGLWRVGGVEVDAGLVWLVAAGERCVSSRATTSTGTPQRISPDDHPYRARWHVSSLLYACHRCFTRLTGHGLTKDQIAATPQCQYPWPGGLRR